MEDADRDSKRRKMEVDSTLNNTQHFEVKYLGVSLQEPSSNPLVLPIANIPIVLGRNNPTLENVLDSFVSRVAATISIESNQIVLQSKGSNPLRVQHTSNQTTTILKKDDQVALVPGDTIELTYNPKTDQGKFIFRVDHTSAHSVTQESKLTQDVDQMEVATTHSSILATMNFPVASLLSATSGATSTRVKSAFLFDTKDRKELVGFVVPEQVVSLFFGPDASISPRCTCNESVATLWCSHSFSLLLAFVKEPNLIISHTSLTSNLLNKGSDTLVSLLISFMYRLPNLEEQLMNQLQLFHLQGKIDLCAQRHQTKSGEHPITARLLAKKEYLPVLTEAQIKLFCTENAFIMGKLLPPSSCILLCNKNTIIAAFGSPDEAQPQDQVSISFDPNTAQSLSSIRVRCSCNYEDLFWCRHAICILLSCSSGKRILDYDIFCQELSQLKDTDLLNLLLNLVWSHGLQTMLRSFLEGPRIILHDYSFGFTKMLKPQNIVDQNIRRTLTKMIDSNTSEESTWIQIVSQYIESLIHKSMVFVKQGLFSHGIQLLENLTSLCDFKNSDPLYIRCHLESFQERISIAWEYVLKEIPQPEAYYAMWQDRLWRAMAHPVPQQPDMNRGLFLWKPYLLCNELLFKKEPMDSVKAQIITVLATDRLDGFKDLGAVIALTGISSSWSLAAAFLLRLHCLLNGPVALPQIRAIITRDQQANRSTYMYTYMAKKPPSIYASFCLAERKTILADVVGVFIANKPPHPTSSGQQQPLSMVESLLVLTSRVVAQELAKESRSFQFEALESLPDNILRQIAAEWMAYIAKSPEFARHELLMIAQQLFDSNLYAQSLNVCLNGLSKKQKPNNIKTNQTQNKELQFSNLALNSAVALRAPRFVARAVDHFCRTASSPETLQHLAKSFLKMNEKRYASILAKAAIGMTYPPRSPYDYDPKTKKPTWGHAAKLYIKAAEPDELTDRIFVELFPRFLQNNLIDAAVTTYLEKVKLSGISTCLKLALSAIQNPTTANVVSLEREATTIGAWQYIKNPVLNKLASQTHLLQSNPDLMNLLYRYGKAGEAVNMILKSQSIPAPSVVMPILDTAISTGVPTVDQVVPLVEKSCWGDIMLMNNENVVQQMLNKLATVRYILANYLREMRKAFMAIKTYAHCGHKQCRACTTNYQKFVDLLVKARPYAYASGKASVWATFVAQLSSIHSSKRALRALISTVEAGMPKQETNDWQLRAAAIMQQSTSTMTAPKSTTTTTTSVQQKSAPVAQRSQIVPPPTVASSRTQMASKSSIPAPQRVSPQINSTVTRVNNTPVTAQMLQPVTLRCAGCNLNYSAPAVAITAVIPCSKCNKPLIRV